MALGAAAAVSTHALSEAPRACAEVNQDVRPAVSPGLWLAKKVRERPSFVVLLLRTRQALLAAAARDASSLRRAIAFSLGIGDGGDEPAEEEEEEGAGQATGGTASAAVGRNSHGGGHLNHQVL